VQLFAQQLRDKLADFFLPATRGFAPAPGVGDFVDHRENSCVRLPLQQVIDLSAEVAVERNFIPFFGRRETHYGSVAYRTAHRQQYASKSHVRKVEGSMADRFESLHVQRLPPTPGFAVGR
jgi:hypothetical protein